MTDGSLVGIDVGTSRVKAVVTTTDGSERSHGSQPTPWRRSDDGGVELDPSALLDAVLGACTQALDGVEGEVLGVGVASMAETGFLHDGTGAVLAPAVGWHDERAGADDVAALERDLPRFSEVTGLWLRPRSTLVRHRWQLRRDPSLARATGWSNVAEHVVGALGGDRVTEPSLASRTGWLDVERVGWWSDSLSWSGADELCLPEIRPAGTPAGRMRGGGRMDGAVLTVAGHDHLCAAIGAGAVTPADVVDSCGSAEVLLRAVPPPMRPEDRIRAAELGFTSGRHVVPGQLALIGGLRSGAVLTGLAEALGVGSPADADRLAAPTPPPSTQLGLDEVDELVAALRQGQRAPDPASAATLWRHGVEAVAAHAARLLADLAALTGPAERLLAVGGSAGDGLVAEARNRHLGPAVLPAVHEAAGRGAALFAGVASGIYDDATAVPRPSGLRASARSAASVTPRGPVGTAQAGTASPGTAPSGTTSVGTASGTASGPGARAASETGVVT